MCPSAPRTSARAAVRRTPEVSDDQTSPERPAEKLFGSLSTASGRRRSSPPCLAVRPPAHRLCFDSSGRATPACTVVPPSPSVAVARSFTRVEHAHASRAVFRRAWSASAPRGPVRHETHADKMSTLAAIAAPFAGEAVAVRRRAPSRPRAALSTRCAASEEVRSPPSVPSRLSPPPGPPPRAPHPGDHVIRHSFTRALTIAIFSANART